MSDTVLLVDDEVEFVETLAERMRSRGLKVDTAHDGQQALQKTANKRYDAIILDLAMPGMSGMEVLKKLRQENPDRQIILLTGQGTVQTAVEATKLGAMDFLEKPTEIDLLLEKIREARTKRLSIDMQRSEKEIADLVRRRGW
jgi:DNA-binding NtrC family response regulator